MSERAMATLRRIDKIEPIEGADKIVKATVGGWSLVTAISNGFKEGDLVVYLEIDSFVPFTLCPFLVKPGHFPKNYNGVEGEKLRTVRLRGQISQGLLLPLSVIPDIMQRDDMNEMVFRKVIRNVDGRPARLTIEKVREGADLTELLGIQKWEAPLSAQLAGQARGNFPSQIPKTDQERIQNLGRELADYLEDRWEITEKMEGSSMTVALIEGEFHVCSRNLSLKQTEGNTFWDTTIKYDLEAKLRNAGDNIAVQGELLGPGVQGGIYGIKDHQFRVFDIYDIKTGQYLLPYERQKWCEDNGFDHVPVLVTDAQLLGETMQSIIAMADGASMIGSKPAREGIVFKSMTDHHTSFKAISNQYLVSSKD